MSPCRLVGTDRQVSLGHLLWHSLCVCNTLKVDTLHQDAYSIHLAFRSCSSSQCQQITLLRLCSFHQSPAPVRELGCNSSKLWHPGFRFIKVYFRDCPYQWDCVECSLCCVRVQYSSDCPYQCDCVECRLCGVRVQYSSDCPYQCDCVKCWLCSFRSAVVIGPGFPLAYQSSGNFHPGLCSLLSVQPPRGRWEQTCRFSPSGQRRTRPEPS